MKVNSSQKSDSRVVGSNSDTVQIDSSGFETTAYGKWILAGEHTVLRGGEALVFPFLAKSLNLKYKPSVRDLHVEFNGTHGSDYQLLFNGLVERAIELLNIPRNSLRGQINLDSDLPVGGGLGASAALCVVVTRLLNHLDLLDETKIFTFAHQLENLFHGESSGVDVAVSLGAKPLIFKRGESPKNYFDPLWTPNWYLSYSGSRGLTSQCVEKVKKLFISNESIAQKTDEQMKSAVKLIKESLLSTNLELNDISNSRFDLLVKGIQKAKSCFESWNLTEGDVDREMKRLLDLGASAVKPTGSGGGGYVLSVWESEPSAQIRHELVKL